MAKRILLVEDNQDNRLIYSMILQHAGYQVMEAADGISGLASARNQRPDLILLDIGLPRISGWEVCAELKAGKATADIKILAITALAFEEDRQRAQEHHMDGYLAKPVEPRRVLEEVRRLIGPP